LHGGEIRGKLNRMSTTNPANRFYKQAKPRRLLVVSARVLGVLAMGASGWCYARMLNHEVFPLWIAIVIYALGLACLFVGVGIGSRRPRQKAPLRDHEPLQRVLTVGLAIIACGVGMLLHDAIVTATFGAVGAWLALFGLVALLIAWAITRRAIGRNERSRRLKTAGILTTGKVTDARERASQFSNGTFIQATAREGSRVEVRYLRGEADRPGGCEIAPNKKFVKGY
jgi:protein-S-isoprenylcysteine O-methyltransferase Ste14